MKIFTTLTIAGSLIVMLLSGSASAGQAKPKPGKKGAGQIQREIDKRNKTKSEWQKLQYASAAAAVLGQFNRDKTVSYAGVAGALYSTYRMEQDRKSKDKLVRERAAFWSQKSFTRKGVRYERRVVNKGGKRYFTFVKAKKK